MINRSLPLTDLHRHLDGNIRLSTIWQLAQEFSIELPYSSYQEFSINAFNHSNVTDLLAFLNKMELGVSVLASEQACYRIAYENVEDAKSAGLHYVELRFSPSFMARHHNLSIEAVVEAVIAGANDASKNLNIPMQLIGILSRSYGVELCKLELKALLQYKQHLCALDLAGDEKGFPAKDFAEHFSSARDAAWQITVHAGEADGPNSIWQAINYLGATRIGHGVAASQDNKLMDYMLKNSIALECCLTSNYQTGACIDTANHPIRTFLDYGLITTLNTDDPGVSGIEIANEYHVAKNIVGLTDAQLKQVQINGLKASFASKSLKEKLLLSP
ncbi:adenosine deaminase [Paraglaciecola marina]|uniref:adenosine deaminase n=1 Tax=Paraglaciecola marina TaxID=2500157 RepID=UPI00105B590E|nr:adenosine deaminase [Paraglaciecola marina]